LIQHQLSHPERKGCVTVRDAFRDLITLMAYSKERLIYRLGYADFGAIGL